MTDDARPLVVGIDGSDAALIALDWAAAEAGRRRWLLRLVNAYLDQVPDVGYAAGVPLGAAGRAAAEEHFDAARQRLIGRGELTVTTLARAGSRRRVLLAEAERAHGLVLGRRGTGRLADLLLGSTSLACATHGTGTPVIIVPQSWGSYREEPDVRRPVVVVGVDGSRRGRAAVDYAFRTATAWGASLRAVLAYDIAADARRYLGEALAGQLTEYPDLPVSQVTTMEHPAVALRDQSADADLVVIGGRGHSEVTGMLLGSVARSVLYLVDRPTAVVHEPTLRR